MTKQTLHQMARDDALEIVYGEGPDPETLTRNQRAASEAHSNVLLTPFVFAFMYICLYVLYGVEKLRGNLK